MIALTEETLAKFERLKPPPGDENPIDSYLDIQREQLELLRGLRDAAESEDSADVQTYETEIGERGAQAESVAQGYGFKECGAAE